jgi:hypothetical protein
MPTYQSTPGRGEDTCSYSAGDGRDPPHVTFCPPNLCGSQASRRDSATRAPAWELLELAPDDIAEHDPLYRCIGHG